LEDKEVELHNKNLKINSYLHKLEKKEVEFKEKEVELKEKEIELHNKNLEILNLIQLANSLRLKSRLKRIIKKFIPEKIIMILKETYKNGFKNIFHNITLNTKNDINIFENLEKSKKTGGKIIVVSHDANKQGAPLLALYIVKHLKKFFNYEVVTILASGGDLQSEFEKYSYVYRFDLLTKKEQDDVSNSLHSNGFKSSICNTSVVGDIVETLSNKKIKVISLIHELPYVVKVAGLENSILKIISKADKIVFPSNYVKNKLSSLFKFDDKKVDINHQGRYMLNNYKFNRIVAKKTLCKNLGINLDSNIVLNIGRGEYRKGLDLFVSTALLVLEKTNNTYFIWIGKCDDEDYENAQSLIKNSSYADKIIFRTFEKDIGLYYSGSDLFFLSSREDPFPSVFIDAVSAELPVVSFDDGGGFVDYLKDIGGELIKDFDVKSMSTFIIDFLNNNIIRKEYEKNFYNSSSDFGFNEYIYNLLELSGEQIPQVSVIVPNYNYEKYIQMRLESIFNQTFKPCEIILLDDNSKDNSLSIAEKMLEESGFDYKVIANKTNQGCYNQWLRGIKEARGDYIWIAEADDLCKNNFLEKVVEKFKDKNVSLTHAQSIAIDENTNEMDFSYIDYTKELSESRWLNDFKNNGHDEIINYLVKLNTIPNASGVVMKKSALDDIEKYITKYTSTGDWFVYIYALQHGDIAFVSDELNYHRRHSNSIIHTVMYEPKLLKEIILISKYTVENFKINPADISVLVQRFKDYYALLPNRKNELSADDEFKNYFKEIEFEYFWKEYIEK